LLFAGRFGTGASGAAVAVVIAAVVGATYRAAVGAGLKELLRLRTAATAAMRAAVTMTYFVIRRLGPVLFVAGTSAGVAAAGTRGGKVALSRGSTSGAVERYSSRGPKPGA
jgi:hypothetical protein